MPHHCYYLCYLFVVRAPCTAAEEFDLLDAEFLVPYMHEGLTCVQSIYSARLLKLQLEEFFQLLLFTRVTSTAQEPRKSTNNRSIHVTVNGDSQSEQ
jgi:hypothetical protein